MKNLLLILTSFIFTFYGCSHRNSNEETHTKPSSEKVGFDSLLKNGMAKAIEKLPQKSLPVLTDSAVIFLDSSRGMQFARQALFTAKFLASKYNHFNNDSIMDIETSLPAREGSKEILLRMVIGKDGKGGDSTVMRGQPGTSIKGIKEDRPRMILLVAGGNGGVGFNIGNGAGDGGDAEAEISGDGSSGFVFGGQAGDFGYDFNFDPNRLSEIIEDTAGPGRSGGDATIKSKSCNAYSVNAEAGNGGNGGTSISLLINLQKPLIGKIIVNRIMQGGNGGHASADCDPRENHGPCMATAYAGNGGNGLPGLPQGAGGPGGRGGNAQAISCCGQRELPSLDTIPHYEYGNAVAVAGNGGNGGNGGNAENNWNRNSLKGGNGKRGGDANASAEIGIQNANSKALGIAGNGGNGGNGGNSDLTGGTTGNTANGGTSTVRNECGGSTDKVDGHEGNAGKQGVR